MTTIRSAVMTLSLIAAASALTPAQVPQAGAPAMAAWWADLEKDEPAASRALLKLAARPAETTAFLRDKMAPLKLDPERVRFLVTMLGDEKDEIWKPAFEELEYLDPRLAIDLETLMKDVTETPARQRMVEVLSGRQAGSLGRNKVDLRKHGKADEEFHNFLSNNGSWWAEAKVARINSQGNWGNPKSKWTRAVRAIALLESFETPEATALIRDMATGHAEAQPTVVAREALDRIALAKKP